MRAKARSRLEIKVDMLKALYPGRLNLAALFLKIGTRHGTVKMILDELVTRGLVEKGAVERAEWSGAPSARYSITETGRRVLDAWVLIESNLVNQP